MLIVMFVFSFGLANFQSTISLYVDKKYFYTPSQIAVIITVGGFVGVIAQTFVINPLFKRFGEMRVILVNLVIAAIAMIGILFVNTFWTILVRCNNLLHCDITSPSCSKYTRLETCRQ